ncbi:uncharacterized protein SCODWIG_02811 [Saccharomycodes ludwigii]|uniref:RanBP2-type domain-containing protein n=1 Tax=Saccharomycodes ludwigii TaxID=36035 RepID=A0A376BAA0_9ASCO|nr:uncharacterized protein SCODWIG_02811 [Saccharomycodes ludwigii]
MKFLVLEMVTSMATVPDATSIEQQPLRQDMNIIKIFWKLVDPLLLPVNTSSIPYNRIEINDHISLQQAITNLHNALTLEKNNVSGNLTSTSVQDIEKNNVNDNDVLIVSLHSTWDIRVLLPYKSRHLNIQLPRWLQFPIIFDLCKEYERWCITDPTRYNIFNAAAMNITKRRKLHSNKTYLYAMLQLLGLRMDLYEMDEFGCIVRIFLSLYEKSILDGFTKPYNTFIDYNQFMKESSKVLYMNNLPSIVTQSELEKWFVSHGCHPIGFWTVKPAINAPLNYSTDKISSTYVPDSDTISGFAIFQSHEEASLGLHLNGYSIILRLGNNNNNNNNNSNSNNNNNNSNNNAGATNNNNNSVRSRYKYIDRVVEIQPSSNIVLTQVKDLLVPFPQTRNKPRPGDWNCPSCGFSNFQKRTNCFRCSFSVNTPSPPPPLTTNNVMGTNSSNNCSNENIDNTTSNGTKNNMNIQQLTFNNNNNNNRSEEHTSELQSHTTISYAVFCLKKKNLSPIHPQLPS